ncbi:hypothetical protein [Mycolicibacterium sp.]|uniref:hypothetical protein n=1 Tax=Mycolicibacterium sp. TaxID=2320850 RepID=UPI0037C651C8
MTITDNANNAAVQQDSTITPEAGETTPTGDNENQTSAGEPDDTEQHADDDAQDDSSRSNREKRYRLRLREAERERDEARDLLARTRQAIVADVVDRSGYTDRVAELVCADMDALLNDDGMPDPENVGAALAAVVKDYGFARKPRPPQPNRQQGHASGHSGGKSSWAEAIKGD